MNANATSRAYVCSTLQFIVFELERQLSVSVWGLISFFGSRSQWPKKVGTIRGWRWKSVTIVFSGSFLARAIVPSVLDRHLQFQEGRSALSIPRRWCRIQEESLMLKWKVPSVKHRKIRNKYKLHRQQKAEKKKVFPLDAD